MGCMEPRVGDSQVRECLDLEQGKSPGQGWRIHEAQSWLSQRQGNEKKIEHDEKIKLNPLDAGKRFHTNKKMGELNAVAATIAEEVLEEINVRSQPVPGSTNPTPVSIEDAYIACVGVKKGGGLGDYARLHQSGTPHVLAAPLRLHILLFPRDMRR